jgi:hypothetical protein
MAARIRSLRNGLTPVDDASRDDLVAGDTVTVTAIDPATTYAWSLVFKPDGSTAAFSGSSSAVSPGTFTVDLDGPYLVRLVTNAGTGTESTQYVRLRALTTAGLRLVAAGERRDGTGIIPVDATPEGWANDQNFNLQLLESLVTTGGTHTERVRVDFTFATPSPISVTTLNAGDVLVRVGLRYTTVYDDPAATIESGDTGTPNLYLKATESSPVLGGLYLNETYTDIPVPDTLTVTLSPGASTQGAGFFVFDLYRA